MDYGHFCHRSTKARFSCPSTPNSPCPIEGLTVTLILVHNRVMNCSWADMSSFGSAKHRWTQRSCAVCCVLLKWVKQCAFYLWTNHIVVKSSCTQSHNTLHVWANCSREATWILPRSLAHPSSCPHQTLCCFLNNGSRPPLYYYFIIFPLSWEQYLLLYHVWGTTWVILFKHDDKQGTCAVPLMFSSARSVSFAKYAEFWIGWDDIRWTESIIMVLGLLFFCLTTQFWFLFPLGLGPFLSNSLHCVLSRW